MKTLRVFHRIVICNRQGIGAGFQAKMDTGAFSSSIDEGLANILELPIYTDGEIHTYRSALGVSTRERVIASVSLFPDHLANIIFSVTDRSRLNFPVLIGRRDLLGFNIQVHPEESDPDNPLNIRR